MVGVPEAVCCLVFNPCLHGSGCAACSQFLQARDRSGHCRGTAGCADEVVHCFSVRAILLVGAESLSCVLNHVHNCACPSQQEKEPEIWKAIRFGTVLENVEYDPHTRVVDYDSKALTENTRACYPIEHIDNARIPCMAGHPKCVSWGLRGSSGGGGRKA